MSCYRLVRKAVIDAIRAEREACLSAVGLAPGQEEAAAYIRKRKEEDDLE